MKILFLRSQEMSHRFIFHENEQNINGDVPKETGKKIDIETDERMYLVKEKVLEIFALTPSLQRQFAMLKELKTKGMPTYNSVVRIVKTYMPESTDQTTDEICRYLEEKLFPIISSASTQAIGILHSKY